MRLFVTSLLQFNVDFVVFLLCLEMLPSLDNFISFGSEMIKSRPDYIQMLLDIYTTSLTNEQLGENDKINGSKLAESMLLNLRGCLNDVSFIFENEFGFFDFDDAFAFNSPFLVLSLFPLGCSILLKARRYDWLILKY